MPHSAMRRLAPLAAFIFGRQAGVAFAAPTCSRVASQWAVVFPAECTMWFEQSGGMAGSPPDACKQDLTGAVLLKTFPWNDAVVVVDNETPGEDFALQPEQDVVKYGSGIVIMQTSWDTNDGMMWEPRMSSSAERIYSEVEYITSDERSYLDFALSVRYEPPPPSSARRLSSDEADNLEDFMDQAFPSDDDGVLAGDKGPEGSYSPAYVYSFEYESYQFSSGFELGDLDSYSYEFIDSMSEGESYSYELGREARRRPPPPDAVQSVTSMDIYVCTDVDNNLAELRFMCNPEGEGDAQCFAEAGTANIRALEIHGMDMTCDLTCLPGQPGGLWCDIFGLDGCRMCTHDCTTLCEGAPVCNSCVRCPVPPTMAPSPMPTDAPVAVPVETMAPSSTPRGLGTMSPTSSPTHSPTETMPAAMETLSPTDIPAAVPVETMAPSSTPRGLGTMSPTSSPTLSPIEMMPAAMETLSPTDTPAAVPVDTMAPSSTPRGLGTMSPTSSPTLSPAEMMPVATETLSPTSAGGSGAPPPGSAAPTAMPSAADTPSPTETDRGLPLFTASPTMPMPTSMETISPTSGPDGSGSAAPTAMPTAAEMTAAPTTAAEMTAAPTTAVEMTAAPTNAVEMTLAPTPGSTGYETPSPTPGSRGVETASPTPGSRGFETASPTPGWRGFETASPTPGSRGLETFSPTPGSRGGFETASPTATSRGGIPMMSAAPTFGFFECTPGDPESCYDQLEPYMRGRLEARSRGLTCEESCIVHGGMWCNALGLNGCRYCATSCENFCAGQGLPDDCECYEC